MGGGHFFTRYTGLHAAFPRHLFSTRRTCAAERCDYRDCDALLYSLADMLNLARTRLIMGSGWSSFSEVAAILGGAAAGTLPLGTRALAGWRTPELPNFADFTDLADGGHSPQGPTAICCR